MYGDGRIALEHVKKLSRAKGVEKKNNKETKGKGKGKLAGMNTLYSYVSR